MQKILIIFIITTAFVPFLWSREHPSLLINKSEAAEMVSDVSKYPLFKESFNTRKIQIDEAIKKGIVVPPPGEAGGYEHERHKQNYRDMQSAGLMFVFTHDEKYALFVKKMLFEYADMYPKLGPHPLSHKQAPGRLFHQLLNEAVWLVYTTQAYDCIYDWLNDQERNVIEQNIFKPMIELFTVEHPRELNRIHNHGIWAASAIGMLGYVLDDQNLVDMALYGTTKDGSGGFLKQLDLLLSPDGYYMEGPYYIRYALRPIFLFAESIERNQPDLNIYKHRKGIIGKALTTTMQTIFPNGTFPPINDASRSMGVKAIGPVIANDIAYFRYGQNLNLLAIANIQGQVMLNKAGFAIAKDLKNIDDPPVLRWGSVEFTDGSEGDKGGLGILRSGSGDDQTMLLMKYGTHGLGHGHFDKLHFSLFDQGSEVIFDYGFARWINVETKNGGRYLKENDTYAKQTIAHNTVTVDQTSQNKSNRKKADRVSGERHFFYAGPSIKVMSARANKYYSGVEMQRTIFLVNDSLRNRLIVLDLFKVQSSSDHEYDYPIHYHGQVISTNFAYEASLETTKALGNAYGYQHIWETAIGESDNVIRFTWLNKNRYYSLISAVNDKMKIIFGRTGADDPNFNLVSEPLIILRKQASDYLFASVIEPHGYFNEGLEQSVQASPHIEEVHVIGSNDIASVVEIKGKNLHWLVMVTNKEASDIKKRHVQFNNKNYDWIGNFKIENLLKSNGDN